jgi:hypothetical protein
VRHEQQFGVGALELPDGLARELLRTDGIDAPYDLGPGCSGDPRQQAQWLFVGVRGCTEAGSRLRTQHPVEHAESGHHASELAHVASTTRGHVEQLRIVGLEIERDLGAADLGSAVIELARNPLAAPEVPVPERWVLPSLPAGIGSSFNIRWHPSPAAN